MLDFNGVELLELVQFGPSHGFINQFCSCFVVSGSTAYSIFFLESNPGRQTMSGTRHNFFHCSCFCFKVPSNFIFLCSDEAFEASAEEGSHYGNPA